MIWDHTLTTASMHYDKMFSAMQTTRHCTHLATTQPVMDSFTNAKTGSNYRLGLLRIWRVIEIVSKIFH
jgi:hypothetical protein